MARVLITQTAEDTLKEYSSGDQEAVARAISILENDNAREADRVDLFLAENDLKVWGFFVGNVFLAFADGGESDVTVIHVALLSRFRY